MRVQYEGNIEKVREDCEVSNEVELLIDNAGVATSLGVIRITSLCNEHPITPHFYIVKLGFTGV